jgi:hypothetical protein
VGPIKKIPTGEGTRSNKRSRGDCSKTMPDRFEPATKRPFAGKSIGPTGPAASASRNSTSACTRKASSIPAT